MKGSIDMEKKLVPVTLLTGYLGAGKQHYLIRFYQTKKDIKLQLSLTISVK